MLIRIILSVILVFSGTALSAKNLINISISEGNTGGIPIAVVPFNLNGNTKLNRAEIDISNIIRADLYNSGQFNVYPVKNISSSITKSEEIDYAYWQNKAQIDNLVIGNINIIDKDRCDISLDVIDVVSKKQKKHYLFENILIEDLRYFGHLISDLLFENFLGVKGTARTRIAYLSKEKNGSDLVHKLIIADSDGYNKKVAVTSDAPLMSPVWSPDGNKIIFVSFANNKSRIKLLDLPTGKITSITDLPGINGAPSWSPDGSKLALVLSKDGSPNIYTLDLQSRQLTRLTHTAFIDTEPYWHPNNREIFFTSSRSGGPQIYKIDLNNPDKPAKRVTFLGRYNATPRISPDGKNLVMMHRDDDGIFCIAVKSLVSDETKILTRSDHDDSPTLSPNGLMVMFGTRVNGRKAIGMVSIDGNFRNTFFTDESFVAQPSWSPLRNS